MHTFCLRKTQTDLTLATLNLTIREQEVLTCLFTVGATKKIALLLGIKPTAVDTHIHHIMQKLKLHSRPHIRDFLEQSGYNTAYERLKISHEFKLCLQKVSRSTQGKNLVCKIICQDHALKERIESDLEKTGISCFDRKKEALKIQIVAETKLITDNHTIIHQKENYYKTFFSVLTQLITDPIVDDALLYFDQFGQKENHGLDPISEKKYKFSTKILIAIACVLGLACSVIFHHHLSTPKSHIRSELTIPHNAYLLQRPQMITQIQSKFKNNKGIQVAVIVGMGGMGKTTLARQYARSQNIGLVWEINAENRKKLLTSFELLALVLAKTLKENKDLDRIRKTENEELFAKQLLQFVKQKIVQQKEWLLIFDNVDNFEDIQAFFPNDVKTWGNGKILITTRDDRIKYNIYIRPQNVVTFSALNLQEQLDLFEKIMTNGNTQTWSTRQKNTAREFLKQIPPFPLDIVTQCASFF